MMYKRPAEEMAELRRAAGVTRDEAAAHLGVSKRTIERAESGNPRSHRPLGLHSEIRLCGWYQQLASEQAQIH